MPNALAGLLGTIDSYVTPAKRRLADLLSNPADYAKQSFGLLGDNMAQFSQNALRAQEGQDLKRMGSVMGDAPMYRNALSQTTNSLMGVAPIGATVWHGSPHKFDKFDSSKIGTGEGAQAYGHGLYLAEHPATAEMYQRLVTQEKLPSNPEWKALAARKEKLVDRMGDKYGISDEQTLRGMMENGEQTGVPQKFVNALNQLQNIQKDTAQRLSQGNLYKVDLPDEHIAKMLDWDKPLSQQAPEVRAAVQRAAEIKARQTGNMHNLANDYAIKDLHDILGPQRLVQAGIPGIRFLDGGSRGAGQGTSNFVVFPGNENLLQILERNGQPIK